MFIKSIAMGTMSDSNIMAHSFKFYDAAGKSTPPTAITYSGFTAKFTLKGVAGNSITSGYTSSAGSSVGAYKFGAANFTGATANIYLYTGFKITFAEPILLTGFSFKAAEGTSASSTYKLTAVPSPNFGTLTSKTFTAVKVSSVSNYAGYALNHWVFGESEGFPQIKVYKVLEAGPDDQLYWVRDTSPKVES